MNKFYLCKAFLIFLTFVFYTQSYAGNNPCSATPLSNDMADFETYSNVGNTDSGVEDPSCGNYVTADIWFSVIAPPNGMLDIVTLAGTLSNGAMAIYEGSCNDLTELYCTDDDNCGNTIMPIMQLDNLTPGTTYYIRIWAEFGAPNGTFQIRVTNGPVPVPPMPTTALVGNAFNTNINGLDCVQLTVESTSQVGCAWDPQQVDMSQPYDMTFELYFGTSNAGADGICWVFHNNPSGLNTCGTGGQEIGANFNNSFIIEMDTYDNGAGFGDIPNDHVAINANGNMGAPLNGPVSLGDIEDGQFHTVRFVWNPGSNFYQVYFDGALQISGTYDIINNCLGGNPNCYWGFTGSTGGAVNNHIICPVPVPQYPAGDEITVEVEICEGESYYAGGANQTTSGLYSDFYFAANGCDSIINTDLTVIPSSEFEYDVALCIGECEVVGPNSFCNSGTFEVLFPNANYLGCDSIVTLNLTVLDPTAVIWPPEPLDCYNSSTILDGTLSTSGPGEITYSWSGPCIASGGNTSIASVDCPGVYTLTITQSLGNASCTSTNSVTVIDNGQPPDADAGDNQTLNCEVSCTVIGGNGSSSGPGISYSWVGPNGYTSGQQFPFVCATGAYVLTVIDLNTGCISTDEIEVVGNNDPPFADAGPSGTLTCDEDFVTLDGSGSSSGPEISYLWTNGGGAEVGTEQVIAVNEPGTFVLIVTNNENGCTAVSVVEVTPDDNVPVAEAAVSGPLTCSVDQVILDGSGSSSGNNISYEWLDPNDVSIGNTLIIDAETPGVYTLIIFDNDNGCSSSASIEVLQNLEVPGANAGNDETLDCGEPDMTLQGSGSGGGNLSFEWQNINGQNIGNDPQLTVDQSGSYIFIVTDLENGCSAQDTAVVFLDANVPVADPGDEGLLTCETTEWTLDGGGSSGGTLIYEWLDGDGNVISDSASVIVESPGIYTLFVTDTDNNCSSNASVEVLENTTPPGADAGEDDILNCSIDEVTLDGDPTGGNPNLGFEWFDENGSVGNLPSLNVSQPGIYTLIVTNPDNGCTNSDEVEVVADHDAPSAQASIDGLLTCVETEVILDGSASSGNSNLTFEWFDENNNSIGNDTTLQVENPGNISLVVTDQNNGCADTTTVTILEDLVPPPADAGEDASLTCDVTEVTLTGTSSGDVAFEWFDGSGTSIGNQASVIVEETGTYTLVVTNNENGCTTASSVEVIPDVNLPAVDAGTSSTLTCAITEATLDGSNSSAGDNFSYEWLDENLGIIDTMPTISVSTTGIYTLIVTNTENGCTASASVEIFENMTPPAADAGQDGTLTCDITQVTLDGSNSSGVDISYEWFNGAGQPVGDQMLFQASQTGTYTLVVTENSNGCTAASQVTVTPDENLPTPVAISDGILTCGNIAVDLDGSASTSISGDVNYEWQDNSGATLSYNESISVSIPGFYVLIVTDPANGCTASVTEFIDENITPPVADAGSTQTLTCVETEVTLTGTGSNGNDLSYEWYDENNNLISNTNTAEVSSPGDFTFVVTNNENGCTATSEVGVFENIQLPAADAGTAETLTCSLTEITLDGSGSDTGEEFSYEWYDENSELLGTDLEVAVNLPGTYTLFVFNDQNGCSAQDEVIVPEDTAPPTAFINTSSGTGLDCDNQSVTLDGTGSSPAGQLSFLWTTIDGNIEGGETTPNPEVDAEGTYTLTITNLLNGCTASTDIFIDEDTTPPVVVIADPVEITCVVEEVSLDATGSSDNGNFSYSWTSNPAGGVISGDGTLQATVDLSANYTLTIINLDNGCQNSATVFVDENTTPPIAVAAADDEFDCVTESVTLSGTGSSVGSQFVYNWSGNGAIDNPNGLAPTVYEPGVFNLMVTNLENGCTQATDVLVEQDENIPTAAAIEAVDPRCYGDPASIAILSVDGGDNPYLYSIDGGNTFSTSGIFNNLDPGIYNILIQDAKGCEYEDVVVIEAAIELTLNLEREIILELGDDYQINAYSNMPESETDTIIWSPAFGLDCADCLNPKVLSILNEITYTVTLIDTSGCSISGQIILRVDKQREVYIPNAFSPNNDGINDLFMIFSNEKVRQINSFQVYDRWGEQVFLAQGFQPNDPDHGWDGTLDGKILNPAVFVYWAEIEFIDGVKQIYKGDVTLMR